MTKVFSFAKKEVNNIVQRISATTALLLLIIITLTAATATTTTGGVISVWAANSIGTSVPDTLEGTDEDDFIDGLGGNDIINDGLGGDEILGGGGDDTIELEGSGEDSSDTTIMVKT